MEQLAPAGSRAVVLFFVATDCPVSNRSFPEMRRLREEFVGQGVRFWFVYPNTTEDPAEVLRHQKTFDPGGDPLQDPAGTLVQLSHAVATPEIAVLVPQGRTWRPVYVGRLDDRFVRLGLERTNVTRHFGEETVQSVLAGRAPAAPLGKPVGCAILNPGVR